MARLSWPGWMNAEMAYQPADDFSLQYWGGGCGRASPSPAVGVPGITPGKFFENSDAKSYILLTNFLLVENYGQARSWGPIHCLSPNQFSRSHGYCAYGRRATSLFETNALPVSWNAGLIIALQLENELQLLSTWMPSPPRRPAVTLTLDLQNLFWSSVGAREYSR